jgi:cytochrome oxidase Cu insertion factor (SCO1/SenC/PrrC family)
MTLKAVRYILWALVFTVGVFFWIVYKSKIENLTQSKDIASPHAVIQIGGDFTLTDIHGKTKTMKDFIGKYQIIYFGYTYCPDICPATLSTIGNTLKLLARDKQEVTPIFISVDPERDTVENLKTYASNFNPEIIMLTGTKKQIADIKDKYKAYGEKITEENMSDYVMDHTSMLYVMDRQGKFIKFLPHGISAPKLRQEIQELLLSEKKAGRQ